MTSHDVLKSWESTKAVFGSKVGTWLALHRICDAGAQGMTVAELLQRSCTPARSTLDRWRAAGLITRTRGCSATNRHTVTYHATAKAYQLLRVEAPQPTEH